MSDKINKNSKKEHAIGLVIEGHDYDGIQELDHPLPNWWLNLFYATIIFSIGYVGYYWILGGPSHMDQLNSAMAKINESRLQSEANVIVEEASPIDVSALMNDSSAMTTGASTYQQVCAVCHGGRGEGLIGPNLTDKYWIHSKGDFDGIIVAIIKGFPDKGMPGWGDIVPKEKHSSLAAYVIKLQGTSPAGAKGPQGELVP